MAEIKAIILGASTLTVFTISDVAGFFFLFGFALGATIALLYEKRRAKSV